MEPSLSQTLSWVDLLLGTNFLRKKGCGYSYVLIGFYNTERFESPKEVVFCRNKGPVTWRVSDRAEVLLRPPG